MPPRRKKSSARLPRAVRGTKVFLLANLVLWCGLGTWYLFQPKERQTEISRLVGNAFDERKQITAFDVAWDLWQIYGSKDYVVALASGDNTHVYAGSPRFTGLQLAAPRVLTNLGYVVGYSEELGNPLWAAYRVRDIALQDAPPRPDNFVPDLRTTARIDAQVYSRSGYDRGHMAPNYAIATRYGRKAQEETFQMSNISPQRHALNAGLWNDLERRIATSYPGRFGEVWVVAGPVFGPNPPRLQRRVAVPEAFFMIIVDESDGRVRAQAFLFPQETPAKGGSLDAFVTTIDEIERRTGLDMLHELPDDAENALEAKAVARVW